METSRLASFYLIAFSLLSFGCVNADSSHTASISTASASSRSTSTSTHTSSYSQRSSSVSSSIVVSSSRSSVSTVSSRSSTSVSSASSLSSKVSVGSTSTTSSTSSSSSSATSSTILVGTGGRRNGVYFTNWGIYGANYQPQQLPASSLTHVFYAFADIDANGMVISSDQYADLQLHYPTDSWSEAGNNAYGVVKQLYLLKKSNRKLKVLLSIGGWTYSSKFAPALATAAGILNFATSAVKLVTDWGFDGVDIDWEYPTDATQAQNYVLLLQACRTAFDAYAKQNGLSYHFLITIASPTGPANYAHMNLKAMDQYVDSWNLMAYDYAGSWDTTTGLQAALFKDTSNPTATKFNTQDAVTYYLGQNINASKLMLGLPLYGRSFENTTGLGQPYSGVGTGDGGAGVWLYKSLPKAGAKVNYDSIAVGTYSYDPSAKELISYDDVTSATTKGQYILQHKLGGSFFWDASGDKTGASSLVQTLAGSLNPLDGTLNNLVYPTSQYDNIKNGMPGS